MLAPRFLSFCFVLLLAACGDDGAPSDVTPADASTHRDGDPSDAAGDSASDSGESDASGDVGDTGADMRDADSAVPADCDALILDTNFRLAAESETNIHPAAAFDGERIWLTYTILEEGSRLFDVALRSVDCAGRAGDEIRVNDVDAESELDSTIAISGERIAVAYQSDSRSGEDDALRPFVRIFDLDGAPIGMSTQVATEREGEAITATNWMSQISARPEGFWLSGTWGVEAISGFQMYRQALDLDGNPGEAASDIAPSENTQTSPSQGSGESPWSAFTELIGDLDSRIVAVRGEERVDVMSGRLLSDHPALSGDLLAFDAGNADRRDIFVQHLTSGEQATIGRITALDSAPAIAGNAEGFAIAWLRQVRGIRNELYLSFGRLTDDGFELGDPVVVPTTNDVFGYTPSLVTLGGGSYFLAWSQGETSPAFEVHGRFVQSPM